MSGDGETGTSFPGCDNPLGGGPDDPVGGGNPVNGRSGGGFVGVDGCCCADVGFTTVTGNDAGTVVAIVEEEGLEDADEGGREDCVVVLLLLLPLVAIGGPGDGVVGGFSLCGDSGGCDESSSIDDTLPCA